MTNAKKNKKEYKVDLFLSASVTTLLVSLFLSTMFLYEHAGIWIVFLWILTILGTIGTLIIYIRDL